MSRGTRLVDELEREWERLESGGEADAALGRWRQSEPALGFATAGDLVAFLADSTVDGEGHDRVLGALLGLAGVEPLAARLVLQRFLPACKRMLGWRRARERLGVDEWVGLVVSTAFEVIVTYPLQRRPRRIAANIVCDLRKRLSAVLAEAAGAAGQLAEDQGEPEGDETLVHSRVRPRRPTLEEWGEAEPSTVEVTETLRWAIRHGHVSVGAARLIVVSRVGGVPLERMAQESGQVGATLRQRRHRAERRLREALEGSAAI